MKIKNLLVLTSMILLGTLFSGFVRPSTNLETTIEEKGGESFAEFLSHFKKTALPFEINLDDMKGYVPYKINVEANENKNKLREQLLKRPRPQKVNSKIQGSKFIPESIARKFSRGGPPIVNPVARFYPNEKTVAVIYTSQRGFSSPIYSSYRMIVYNLRGKIISPSRKMMKKKKGKIAGNYMNQAFDIADCSTIETTTCRIDKKGQIWVNTYKNIWKDDLRDTPYHKNQLVDFELKNTEVFEFDKNGIAMKLKEIPSDARASLD